MVCLYLTSRSASLHTFQICTKMTKNKNKEDNPQVMFIYYTKTDYTVHFS